MIHFYFRPSINIWGASAGILILAACTSPLEDRPLRSENLSQQRFRVTREMTHVFSWGNQPQEVGFRPQAAEQRAEGVSSVAVGPAGEIYLLDRLNSRVLQVQQGELKPIVGVPITAEEIAVGPTGTLAIFSPLQAWVRLFDNGLMTGQIKLPLIFREVRQISLGPSRMVAWQNAYQETLTLGTPALPQSLETILHSRREGAFFLPDGTGVAVRLSPDSHPEVLLLEPSEKSPAKARFLLKDQVLAARVVGVAGQIICLRLEFAVPGDSFTVGRRAVCLDARDGQLLLDKDLSHPGPYVPRKELALGGSPPRLAFIKPEREGLHLVVWEIVRTADGRGQ